VFRDLNSRSALTHDRHQPTQAQFEKSDWLREKTQGTLHLSDELEESIQGEEAAREFLTRFGLAVIAIR
jgi:hypothetical protein